MFDVLLVPLALVLFGVLAFKRWSAIIIGPLISLLLVVASNMPIFESMIGPYMKGSADYVKNFFLVFMVGALFGAIYEDTRAAESIARAMSKVTKGKFTAPLIMVITGVLTFGGISGFVVFFAIYPIAQELFKSANLSRRLMPAAISAGCWTWSMSSPGTPAIQNIIPMRFLETSSMAAPITGAIGGIAEFVMIFLWLEYRARKMAANGEKFVAQAGYDMQAHDEDLSKLPNPWIAMIPPVAILVLFNIVKIPVEGAVLAGALLAIALLWKHVDGGVSQWIGILNKGGTNSCTAILNTALVVGFASIVRQTAGFKSIIDSLLGLQMPPLVFVAITVAIAAGAAGSASGGMGVAFDALKQTYVELGVNLQHVHRIAAIASGTLDTLPHQGAQITLLNICGQTHKDAYWDIAVTQIIVPFLALAIVIPLMSMGLM